MEKKITPIAISLTNDSNLEVQQASKMKSLRNLKWINHRFIKNILIELKMGSIDFLPIEI